MESDKSFEQSKRTLVGEAPLGKNPVFVREVLINYRGRRKVSVAIKGPDDIANFIRNLLPDNSREHFVAIFLNGSHQVIAYSIVGTGIANSCLVHPREVFQGAILVGALAIAVAHNHPSNSTAPSEEDKKVTRVLGETGQIIGIKMLDHLVITEDSFYSFANAGALLHF